MMLAIRCVMPGGFRQAQIPVVFSASEKKFMHWKYKRFFCASQRSTGNFRKTPPLPMIILKHCTAGISLRFHAKFLTRPWNLSVSVEVGTWKLPYIVCSVRLKPKDCVDVTPEFRSEYRSVYFFSNIFFPTWFSPIPLTSYDSAIQKRLVPSTAFPAPECLVNNILWIDIVFSQTFAFSPCLTVWESTSLGGL